VQADQLVEIGCKHMKVPVLGQGGQGGGEPTAPTCAWVAGETYAAGADRREASWGRVGGLREIVCGA
jgi:hypothetical protein